MKQNKSKRQVITSAAAQALNWTHQHLMQDGQIRLPARKVVVLGGAAEMASTRQFIAAGASVLWIDRVEPQADWRAHAYLYAMHATDRHHPTRASVHTGVLQLLGAGQPPSRLEGSLQPTGCLGCHGQ